MKSVILTDVDSVLLDYDGGFFTYASKRGFGALPFTNTQHVTYETRLNISTSQVLELLNDFSKSDDFKRLLPYRDAQPHMELLSATGYKFIAVTACGDAPHVVSSRISNLKACFGDVFEDIICLPIQSPKDHILKEWQGSKKVWIEDHPEHSIAGAKLGLRSVLIDQLYNTNVDDTEHLIYRVPNKNPWQSIVGYIQFIEDMGSYEY